MKKFVYNYGFYFLGCKTADEERTPKESDIEVENCDGKNCCQAENEDDVDMDKSEDSSKASKSSAKNAKVPLHLLSQRKLRKLQLKRKQKNSKKKYLKW